MKSKLEWSKIFEHSTAFILKMRSPLIYAIYHVILDALHGLHGVQTEDTVEKCYLLTVQRK